MPKRDANGRWQPGASGNPNGRPRRDMSITNALQLAKARAISTDDDGNPLTVAVAAARWLAECAATGVDRRRSDQGVVETVLPYRDRLDAIRAILAQCEGWKQDELVDESEAIEMVERVASLSPEELALLAKIGAGGE